MRLLAICLILVAAGALVATSLWRPARLDAARTAAATANLWVDESGGSCSRTSAAAAYRDGGACASLDAAWDACRPGDTVVIRPGIYGAQTITGDKSEPGCVVRGEGVVTIGDLTTRGAFLTLENVTVDVGSAHRSGWHARAGHVTLRNVRLHGPYVVVDISGVDEVRWVGGELGTAGTIGGARICGEDAEPVQVEESSHVTIDGVSFHPQDADPTPNACSANGFHLEMMRLDEGTSFFTLRNSTFDNGDHSGTASVFITEPGGGQDPHDLTFTNNFFGTNESVGAFDVHQNVETCSNFTFAYNTFLNSPGVLQCTSSSNVLWVGNLGAKPAERSCDGTYTDNVWQDSTSDRCGTDKWISGQRGKADRLGLGGKDGFHLVAGSPAIDAGEAAGYCVRPAHPRDHDNHPRHIGVRCDAGAAEYEGPDSRAVVASVTRVRWPKSARAGATLRVTIRSAEPVTAVLRGRGIRPPAQRAAAAGTQVLDVGVRPGRMPKAISVVVTDLAHNRLIIHEPLKPPR